MRLRVSFTVEIPAGSVKLVAGFDLELVTTLTRDVTQLIQKVIGVSDVQVCIHADAAPLAVVAQNPGDTARRQNIR